MNNIRFPGMGIIPGPGEWVIPGGDWHWWGPIDRIWPEYIWPEG